VITTGLQGTVQVRLSLAHYLNYTMLFVFIPYNIFGKQQMTTPEVAKISADV
jgi:hypothetical protein